MDRINHSLTQINLYLPKTLLTPLPRSFWPSIHRLTTARPWPPSGPDGARSFIEHCSWHGLLPLLFEERDLPGALAQALAGVAGWRRILEVRARLFDEAIATLCRALDGEPFVLLKGADFAHRLYPSPFLRPMQDLDLLVPSHRIDVACDRLMAAGLVPQPAFGAARDPRYMERVFFLGKILVEVHQSFIQQERHSIDYEEVWNRREPFDVLGRRAARLEDVDAVLYQALSISIDELRVRLIRYLDLWLLLTQREGLVVAAADRARDWSSVRALYCALSLGCRVIPEFRTKEVEEVRSDLLPRATRLFLDRCVLPGAVELGQTVMLPRSRQLWRKALLMDTPRHRLSFAISHARAALRG